MLHRRQKPAASLVVLQERELVEAKVVFQVEKKQMNLVFQVITATFLLLRPIMAGRVAQESVDELEEEKVEAAAVMVDDVVVTLQVISMLMNLIY